MKKLVKKLSTSVQSIEAYCTYDCSCQSVPCGGCGPSAPEAYASLSSSIKQSVYVQTSDTANNYISAHAGA